jgi:hypothetical protein
VGCGTEQYARTDVDLEVARIGQRELALGLLGLVDPPVAVEVAEALLILALVDRHAAHL